MKITTATAQGNREYQEDRFLVHSTGWGKLAAVMDGHGGDSVSQIVLEALPNLWDVAFQNGLRPVPVVIQEVVASLDTLTEHYGPGSTLSLVFVPDEPGLIHGATVGDSPVVADAATGLFIGPDHNARSNPSERDAALARGGFYHGGYLYQTSYGSGLQMARALGDASLGRVVSKTPELFVIKNPQSFVLLATDGVFDPSHSVTEQQIQNVVDIIHRGGDAQALVDSAVQRKTQDNATAVLIKTKENQ